MKFGYFETVKPKANQQNSRQVQEQELLATDSHSVLSQQQHSAEAIIQYTPLNKACTRDHHGKRELDLSAKTQAATAAVFRQLPALL